MSSPILPRELKHILHSINQKSNETALQRQINEHNKNEILKKNEELEDRVAIETLRIQTEMQL